MFIRVFSATLFILFPLNAMALDPSEHHYELKLFGKCLFFDKISSPKRQSCSTCHDPASGWTNGSAGVNKKQVAVTGANPHTVGNLRPPSNAYATLIRDFSTDANGRSSGGNLWDGRAKGNAVESLNVLGNKQTEYAEYLCPTADQGNLSPFINPVEQGLEDRAAVCEFIRSSRYAPLYTLAWGEEIDCTDAVTTFGRFAVSLAAYQSSREVNAFDSKFDKGNLSEQETLGHELFNGKAQCFKCHTGDRFTSDGYANIGVPRNLEIPGSPPPAIGLEATTGSSSDRGKVKIPTLRNVDKRKGNGFTKAYTHNGWFKSLESIVHFYNTRDVKQECSSGATEREALAQDCWPKPAFSATKATIIGNLGLTVEEEAAIVSFLRTLTDTKTPKPPKPYNGIGK
jgi:cytochrome c peroxidase